jgi:hypothetical protein
MPLGLELSLDKELVSYEFLKTIEVGMIYLIQPLSQARETLSFALSRKNL